MPLISILIVCRNDGTLVGRVIHSVLDQTCRDFEVIVVVNPSQRELIEVIRSFQDPRVVMFFNDLLLDGANASKEATAICRGKYLCFLDPDDYFHPDKLARQLNYMNSHHQIDALATFVHYVGKHGENITDQLPAKTFNHNLNLNQPEHWLWENRLFRSSVMMKREVHDQLWDYESGLSATNDWHNWIQFLANGKVFDVLPEQLTYGLRHTDVLATNNRHRIYWEYAYISARFFHPYLETIGRHDLVRQNIRRFMSDYRYPDSKLGRERLLRLLLFTNSAGPEFGSIWDAFLNSRQLPCDGLHSAVSLIAEAWEEITERNRHLDSIRVDIRRAENEIFKVEQLLQVLFKEKFSRVSLAKIGYLTVASIVPDLLKWPLRPLIGLARRQFRRVSSHGNPKTHRLLPFEPRLSGRPKVVHAIANFNVGGSSRLIADIIEHLGPFFDQRVISGFIPAPPAYGGCIAREYRHQYEISRFLEKCAPDIVHVHYWGDTDWSWYDKVFRATEQLGCKTIENVNTPTRPYIAKSIRHYVYVSHYVRDTFGQDEEAHSVVYPGSDFDLFSGENRADKPDNCIGMVYRLEPDKLNDEAIEPFILVAQRRPGTHVLIVGEGSQLDLYKARVAESGLTDSFEFTGTVPYADLPELYARLSVFVAPVWRESFGQVTPFAMSMGIPVAGYTVGALAEILGDGNLLAPPGDSERLAEIIVKLLDDRPARLAIGNNNRKRALSLFSVGAMIARYDRIYRDIIEEAG